MGITELIFPKIVKLLPSQKRKNYFSNSKNKRNFSSLNSRLEKEWAELTVGCTAPCNSNCNPLISKHLVGSPVAEAASNVRRNCFDLKINLSHANSSGDKNASDWFTTRKRRRVFGKLSSTKILQFLNDLKKKKKT